MNIKKTFRFIYFVFPIVLFAGMIFYVSSLSTVVVPSLGIDLEDKLIHMSVYFIFGWLLTRAFHFGKQEPISKKVIIISLLIGLFYGFSDELHQYFVPGRSSEFWDWLADSIGIILGIEFYRRFYKFELQFVQHVIKTTNK
jgi:VanZ family protein